MLVTNLAELGELIRRRRIELALSQTELALQVGATRQWISRLENGRHEISTARLFVLLAALDLNLDILRPRPAGTVTGAPPRAKSILPAAALQAIRQLPAQIHTPNLPSLGPSATPAAEGTASSSPDFTKKLSQILWAHHSDR